MGLDNPLHIAILVVILLVVFGAKRLPEMGRSIGMGMREFKDSISGDASTPAITQAAQQPQPPAQAVAAPEQVLAGTPPAQGQTPPSGQASRQPS
ncbi:MAG TPA: twin-arginine translocase TatA/TatE family subunit [Solirubrobacteraceae bacterium]